MTQESHVLYTADPVRNAGWWLRTLMYWLVLVAQQTPEPGDVRGWLLWILVVVGPGVAVFLRDRHPWAMMLIGVLLGITIAEALIAVGLVVVVARSEWGATMAAVAVAVGGVAAPGAKVIPWGITLTPTGLATELIMLVLVPAMIGVVRRSARETRQTRLRYESEQRELAAEQAVTEERNRIAQEMHDLLGHKLSLITVQAGALQVNADGGPDVVREQAELIRATSRQALDELRTILGVLGQHPAEARHPQPGLPEALALVGHYRTSGMLIDVDHELPERLVVPPAVGAAIHRVLREGLTNVLRHAPGAAVRLGLSFDARRTIRVELVNERPVRAGAGPGTGRGLPGMTERVRSLGGTLQAGPTDAGGYRLCAELPLPADEGTGDA